jgi:hypothetical protein
MEQHLANNKNLGNSGRLLGHKWTQKTGLTIERLLQWLALGAGTY